MEALIAEQNEHERPPLTELVLVHELLIGAY
jgi:hypothetical protein